MPDRYNPISSMNNIIKNHSNIIANSIMTQFFRYLKELKSTNDRKKKN